MSKRTIGHRVDFRNAANPQGLRFVEGEDGGSPAPTPAEETPAQETPKPEAPEIDWKAKAREWEKRAKDNKAAADKLAEIEEATKTEAQKQAERLASLEREAQQARTEALRFKIASKFQITDEDAELFLTGSDEDTLTKQAERLAQRNEEAGKPRAPKPDLNQGKSPQPVNLTGRAADVAQIEADLAASRRR